VIVFFFFERRLVRVWLLPDDTARMSGTDALLVPEKDSTGPDTVLSLDPARRIRDVCEPIQPRFNR
jgi:hypothetical protein